MKPFIWHSRVYYEDTDAGGVVYYANYLKFMERARTEWLRAIGFEQDVLASDLNILFAVRSVSINYKQPAKFNDMLVITVEPYELKPASISFKQVISKQDQGLEIFATAEVNVVCLSANNFSPKRIPKSLFQDIDRGIKSAS